MSDELKASRILFIIGAVLTFLGSLVAIVLGIIALSGSLLPQLAPGVLLILPGVALGIIGGLKLWCAKLVKEERKLTTAGVLGIIFGIIPGDIITLIAGILVLVKKEETRKNKNPASKSKQKK